MEMTINKAINNSGLTAMKRNTLSRPMKYLFKAGLVNTTQSILDYGCGKGDDVRLLQEKGFDIVGYDLAHNDDHSLLNLSQGKYDAVTCNYVFNVIDSLIVHKQCILKLKKLSDNVYISVRSDVSSVQPIWLYDRESIGYYTTRNTFQRFYNEEMISSMFGDVEYLVNTSSHKLFKLL